MSVNAKTLRAFRWSGLNANGNKCSGLVYAANKLSARVSLYGKGINATRLRQDYQLWSHNTYVPIEKLGHFMYQLSTVVRCGMAISPALSIVARATQHRGLSAIIEDINCFLENGISLSHALENHPKIFDTTVCALIRAGEHSGTLATMLERAANYLIEGEAMRAQIRQALFYPVLLSALAVLVLMFFMLEVIPAFAQSFAAFNAELPLLTRLVIDAANLFAEYSVWLLMCLVALFIALYGMRRSTRLRYVMAHIKRRVPFLTPIFVNTYMARFCMVLATMLEAKITLTDALRLAGSASSDYLLTRLTATASHALSGSAALHTWMSASGQFPLLLTHMVYVGESTGRLTDVLRFLTKHYEKELKYKTQRLNAILEPSIIAMLSIVIGILILAMYLPIFELGNIL